MNLKSSIIILLFLVFSSNVIADVVLTDEEYDSIIGQFERDKKAIDSSQKRWDKLRTAIPEIKYSIERDVVVQSLIIPVQDDTPLEFQNKFKLHRTDKQEGFFPFILRLAGGIETVSRVDAKIGVKIFGLRPLSHEQLRPLGLNLLLGIKSSAFSASYDLPQPFSNTSVHLYYGLGHSEDLKKIIGIGISLNF